MAKATKASWSFKQILKLSAAAGGAFAVSQLAFGSECFYSNVLMPTVHTFVDPESAHKLGVKAVKFGLIPRFGDNLREYGQLQTTVMGLKFNNPVGIAAGFDKDGEAIEGLQSSGLGFVEIGSVTPRPQSGNAKPRVFRLYEDNALINRYGFNSAGVGVVSDRVKSARKSKGDVPLGINLGKNKDSEYAALDYEIGSDYFANYCDYLVINVSSPNTPGLRSLQSKAELENILSTVNASLDRMVDNPLNRPKLLLKITSDLERTDRKDVARVVLDKRNKVDGLIISNTTISRPESLKCPLKSESGGLSGEPLKEMATECIKDMYRLTNGKVPIVGVGGIANGKDAYEKIRAGASLVQFYTSLVYDGFPVIGKIKRELRESLIRDGFGSVNAAVGADVKLDDDKNSPAAKAARWWFW